MAVADSSTSGMLATLIPVVIGGVIALAGTWLGPWISERHKEKQEKRKTRALKFEELVATVYEFDHWLDRERDANITGVDYVSQGMSPLAKLDALAAVHFPQFDELIRELDTAADRCVIWMTNIRLKQVSKTLGDNPLEGFREVIEPYTEKRNNLLKALREFAHKEFQ
jgi:hypothetical protein